MNVFFNIVTGEIVKKRFISIILLHIVFTACIATKRNSNENSISMRVKKRKRAKLNKKFNEPITMLKKTYSKDKDPHQNIVHAYTQFTALFFRKRSKAKYNNLNELIQPILERKCDEFEKLIHYYVSFFGVPEKLSNRNKFHTLQKSVEKEQKRLTQKLAKLSNTNSTHLAAKKREYGARKSLMDADLHIIIPNNTDSSSEKFIDSEESSISDNDIDYSDDFELYSTL